MPENKISERLASVLGLPFPLKDDAVSLTDEQKKMIERADKGGNTQLMTAAEFGEGGSVEFLICQGADVNYRNTKTQQRAIDLAWDQGHYESMLLLLKADSEFPETFHLGALLEDKAAPEELVSFVKEIDHLHEWIREGNVRKIDVIFKEKNLRYVNSAGQSAMETAVCYGDVKVLACLLGLPFPIPPGEVSLPKNKAYLLTITNAFGDTPLLSAAKEGRKDNVDLLIRCGANIHFLATTGKTAADLAWENNHYEVVLVLLEADSNFPRDFALCDLRDGFAKELEEFVDSRSELHKLIRMGSLQEVKKFIEDNGKPSRKYLNVQGQSALYTAMNEKMYETYAFLKSIGVYFKDEQEEICLDKLKIDEKVELKRALIQYFPKVPDSHIFFLVSKSRSSRPRNDFRDTVYNIYKNLDEIPLISKMLQVIQYADYIEVVFDFDREDVSHLEPRHSTSTRGATDYKSGRLYVGFKMDTPEQESECLGTLAHELAHLAMQITFQNDCNPYRKSDTLGKSYFVNEIVTRVRETCINSEDVNYIIKRVFTDYKNPEDWPAELIVRVPQIMAQYGEYDGIDIINTHTTSLLSYFSDKMMSEFEKFVQQNFLIKPRNMIKTLNQYLGHLNELEKADIIFIDITFRTEFFESTAQNIFLINTSNTWLSSLRFHQALQKVTDYSLPNSYLVLRLNDFEEFQEDIMDAFSSDANNLMVIECYQNMEQKLFSNVLKDAARVFRLSKHKKIVMIIHNDDVVSAKKILTKERLSSKILEHTDKDYTLADLSNESQSKLLCKEVIFQGFGTVLHNIIDDEATNMVDSETLVQLICNKDIVIGNKLVDLDDVKDYYIERSFNIHTEILEDILKDESVSDLFLICGLNLVRNYHNVHICTDGNRNAEEQLFSELCENYVNHNIHYLRSEDSRLIWIKTKGSLSELRKYINTSKSTTYSESEIIEDCQDQGPIIISDTAGMGKTTVMTNLGLKMKRKFPFSWVLRIDLNNYNHELEQELKKKEKNLKNADLDVALNFLLHKILKVRTQFEENVLTESFKKRHNVIMLFDGFDEISPLYKDIVLNFIETLNNSTIKKIFVTCRPYVAELLEERFGIFCFGIKPFSSDSKKEFLVRFWKKRFSMNKVENPNEMEEKKLELVADALIQKLSVSINDRQQSFTGIPLQLRMVGEIFPDSKDTEGLGDMSSHSTLPEILNLVDLYKLFVDKKYDIYKIEKLKPATAIAAADVEEGRQTFIKNHQKIAVYTLIPNGQHPILLSDEDIDNLEIFLDRIIEGKEKTGIIDGVIQFFNRRQPHFIHLTFAEYFVASFLSLKLSRKSHPTEIQKFMLTNIFVMSSNEVVRHFLNVYMGNLVFAEDILEAYGTVIHDLWLADRASLCTLSERTAFHIAVLENNDNIIRFFLLSLDKQRETLLKVINAEDKNGQPVLHTAVENGNFEILKWLVENGATVNVKENDGKTVLYYAAKHNVQLLEYLVRHGADIKSADMVQLYLLNMENDNENVTFKWLVENGGDVNVGDMYGVNVLYHAAMKGDLETIKWLIDTGEVDIVSHDGDERSLLHYSAGSEMWEVVKWLLTNNIFDVNLKDENGNTVLHYAAYKGNGDVVQWLINSKDQGGCGANVNIVDKNGRTLLHEVASSGNLELMKWLVALPDEGGGIVDVNSMDHSRNTVLHEAALFGQIYMLEWLLGQKENGGGGADINTRNKHGQTALDNAASLGLLEVVKILISRTNDYPLIDTLCKRILHKSASFGELKLVEWLLQNARVDVNYREESGKCLLHYAAKHNNYEVVKFLLELDAGVNTTDEEGKTALHEAAGTGVHDIEEWLEERCIYIKSVDGRDEMKAITIELKPNQNHLVLCLKAKGYQVNAMGFGRFNFHVNALGTLKLLLESGADTSTVDKHGRTPLYYATFHEKPGVVGSDILKLLVTPVKDSGGGANINIVDDTGKTLMHKLAEGGEYNLMKWLFETNSDFRELVNVADTNGSTPLHFAAAFYWPKTILLLASCGADICVTNKYKRTALHEAAIFNYFETLQVLVVVMKNHSSDIGLNVTDLDGYTALHYASIKGNLQSVKWLARHGANINVKDNLGRTPFHLAASCGELNIVKYLVERNVLDLQDNDGKTALDLAIAQKQENIISFLKKNLLLTESSRTTSTSVNNFAEFH